METNALTALLGTKKAKVAFVLTGALLAFLIAFTTLARAQEFAADCSSYAQPDCSKIPVGLPLGLSFGGPVADTIADKDGEGTGFTMVQPSSGGEYLPANLDVGGDQIKITTTNGIQYRTGGTATNNFNSLDNGLGAGFDAAGKVTRIETTIASPPNGSNKAEQAGLWFGPDEDNYIKLVIGSTGTSNSAYRFQMMKEIGGGTNGNASQPPEEINTLGQSLANKNAKLVLLADAADNTVTGYYSVDGGVEQELGSFPVPASFFDGSAQKPQVDNESSFAGIFATHRNRAATANPTSLTYAFNDFGIREYNPPAVPVGLTAAAANGQVNLDWDDDNAEGYNVYRGTSPQVDTSGAPLNGQPLTDSAYADNDVSNGTIYYYAVKAVNGEDVSEASETASAMPDVAASETPVATLPFAVNFQSEAAPVPDGYVKDFGKNYSNAQGYGWLEPGTSNPLSLDGNGRDRNLNGDQRLDTVMHAQGDDVPSFPANLAKEGVWEVSLPDGSYDVEVAVGDPSVGADPEVHSINVEGENFIDSFEPTGAAGAASRHETATETVAVDDGRLTIDAIGGTNTKINYVIVSESETVPANNAPAASDDSYQADQDTTLEVGPGEGVLANDTDADDDTLTASLGTDVQNGALTLNEDGSFSYQPDAGYAGEDSFTYTASDGTDDSAEATTNITVNQATVVNQPPEVTDPGDQSSAEGDEASLQIDATDPDADDTLSYEAAGLPAGLSIDPATGEISGAIAVGAAADSPYATTVTATDDGDPVESGTAEFSWTVSEAADTTAPEVVSTSPTDGAVGVATDANVSAAFSEAMDETTITGSTFTLSGEGGAVPAIVGYDATGDQAVLDPTGDLAAGANYTASLDAASITDAAGNALGSEYISWQFTTEEPADTTAPAPVSGLSFDATPEGIKLVWNASPSNDVVGYNVYRSENASDFDEIASDVSATGYDDTTAPVEQGVYYQVTAVDASDNESAPRGGGPVERPAPEDTTAPAAPKGLSASSIDQGVALDWNDSPEGDLGGYIVYRSDSFGGEYTRLNADLLAASEFEDGEAPVGAVSYYRVTAVDDTGNESNPAIDDAIRPEDTTAPEAPQNLTAQPGDGQIVLAWDAVEDWDLAGYNVYRDGQKISGDFPVSANSFTDDTAENGTEYAYTVSAVDGSNNESDRSSAANVTPEDPNAAKCSPRSTLACEDVTVSAPVALEFSGDEGGLAAGDGADTGFTMVDPPSARLAADDPVGNSDVPGYEPDNLAVADGELTITSTKGIMYKRPADLANTNSQINALGVGVDATGGETGSPTLIETTIQKPAFPNTSQAQQGGLWFGLDEDNYAKLVVFNQGGGNVKFQMLREIDALSANDTNPAVSDERNTTNIAVADGAPIDLALEATPPAEGEQTGSVSGTYQIQGGQSGELAPLTLPAKFFEGEAIAEGSSESASFAGVFATHRNGSVPIDASFQGFSVSEVADTEAPTVTATTPDAGATDVALDADVNAAFSEELDPATVDAQSFTLTTEGASEPVTASVSYAVGEGATLNPDENLAEGVTYTAAINGGAEGVADLAGNPLAADETWTFTTVAAEEPPQEPSDDVALGFDAATPDTIPDKDDEGTGFTLVQDSSNGGGYLKENLDIDPGRGVLDITTTSGLQYKTDNGSGPKENALNNGLGVDFDATGGESTVSTTLVDLPGGTNTFQQAGLWFGPGEDDYVKLVVNTAGVDNHKVQMVREIGGVSTSPANGQLVGNDEINSTNQNMTGKDLELSMQLDSSGTATAFYSVDGAALQELGQFSVPASWFAADSEVGIFASHRNHNGPLVYSFDDFNLSAPTGPGEEPAPDFDAKVNFQNPGAAVPSGYVRDYGQAYGERTAGNQGTGLSYGWVEPGTSAPLDLSTGGTLGPGNGRERDTSQSDQRLETLMHMQADDLPNFTQGVKAEGAWEISVPNGNYEVTVAAGDSSVGADPEVHSINVEGENFIDSFEPTGAAGVASRHETATETVAVDDGRLTIDAIGGTNTKINYVDIQGTTQNPDPAPTQPSVAGSDPADGDTNVALSTAVSTTNLNLIGSGVDNTTLSGETVKLIKVDDDSQVEANVNGTGGGDAITLTPATKLEKNTEYRFEITAGVKDLDGLAFEPYEATFTTGETDRFNPPGVTNGDVGNSAFDRVALPDTRKGQTFTSVTMGPDDRLYAATVEGDIYSYASDEETGELSDEKIIDTVKQGNNGKRLIMGLTFEPGSTAADPKLWVSHSTFGYNNMKDWGGKISVISGSDLGDYRDVVTNLPRSARDHQVNSIAFHNGKMYLPVGATTAMGAWDTAWKGTERLLSTAIIEVDYQNISGVLDVKTADGGTYDPYAPDAPVKIYATGVRNAVDLVWHSNGELYVPTNGSAGGSNTPATPQGFEDTEACQTRRADGPYTGPAIADFDGDTQGPFNSSGDEIDPNTGEVQPRMRIAKTQEDHLYRVEEGGYYGSPNPTRCEWVLNGGNPTSGTDPGENPAYPVGTEPDRNWRGWAYNFELNKSPNGAIEYKSNNFGGKLKGKLLVVRYSQGDDVIVLTPTDPNGPNRGDVTQSNIDVPGLGKNANGLTMVDPLDLTEDTRNGNLYVTEGVSNPPDGSGKITLLKARDTGDPDPAEITLDKERIVENAVIQGNRTNNYNLPAPQTVTVENTGGSELDVSGLAITGADAGQFLIAGQPASYPATLAPGEEMQAQVQFDPTTVGPKDAALEVRSSNAETASVKLRGLGTRGLGGSNEPSLQWVLDTYEVGVDVGDDDPSTNVIHGSQQSAPLLGDEISAQTFEQVGSNPVEVEPLAVFGPDGANPVTRFGYYGAGNKDSKKQLFEVSNNPASNAQTLNVPGESAYTFEPTGDFGFYSTWPFFDDREVYGEDSLNTFNGAIPHHVRVYPIEGEQNAYIVATEENVSGFDYQDVVVIVRNVKPVAGAQPDISVEQDELVFSGTKDSTSEPQSFEVQNTGDAALEVNATTTGQDAGAFDLVGANGSGDVSVPAGESRTFEIAFAPNGVVGSLEGALSIESNDPDESPTEVGLYGLSANGLQGNNEPALQSVVDTLGYDINVGGTQLILGTNPAPIGDEVRAQLFQKAGSGEVGIKPVARYSPDELLPFGYYTLNAGSPNANTVATITTGQEQTLNPAVQSGGASGFDPGNEKFGIFVDSNTFGRKSYQQDAFNTGPTDHAVRVYPAKNRAGEPLANTYLVSFEDASNGDYQDYVFLVTNVEPASTSGGGGGEQVSAKINFQPAASPTPEGYTADSGQGYDETRGYGWVQPGTSTPVDLSAQTRDRNLNADQRLDTLVIMQSGGGNQSLTNGSWEYDVPNGTYEVTLSVGDPGFTDSTHRVNVEGVNAIDDFSPGGANGSAARHQSATVMVDVTDGRLTIDADGGDQTKINYIDIVGEEAPATGETEGFNFQPETVNASGEGQVSGGSPVPTPEGYTPDYGNAYDASRGYGWIDADTGNPVDARLNTRYRTASGAPSDLRLATQMQMQGTGAATQPVTNGAWEYDVPNGVYDVELSVGDQFVDSIHRVNVEGTPVIEGFDTNGQSQFQYQTGSATVEVADGKLTVDALGGANTKINYIDITPEVGPSEPDITDPTVNIELGGAQNQDGAYKNRATVTVDAADEGGSGLASTSYSVDGGPFQAYEEPFEVAGVGAHTVEARAIDGAGNVTTVQEQFDVVEHRAEIRLENLDGVPYDDRLVFNRIQNPSTTSPNGVHDESTLRVHNDGPDPLTITALDITPEASFELGATVELPQTVAPNSSLDVPVRFVHSQTSGSNRIIDGTLTISSDDADEGMTEVELSGAWQRVSEGGVEPDMTQIAQVYGYGTTIVGAGQNINNEGRIERVGDEILSPYWKRADGSAPVSVRQLAAFHTQGNTATFFWHNKGSNSTTGVVTHAGVDGQSFLPRKNGQLGQPASGSFTPAAGATFGFKIDPEWSDPTKNNKTPDDCAGGQDTCGQHMRFWPAMDRSGAIIPNTYLVTMDYAGINYDFQDNVYLVKNIKPEDPTLDPATPGANPGDPSLELEFDEDYPDTLADADGTGTGFTTTQPNSLDVAPGSNSYDPTKLDVNTGFLGFGSGSLAVTTSGSTNGGATNGLVNGLRLPFDGTGSRFTVNGRLFGPLDDLNVGARQGGVMLGSDQDNFVKVVAINRNGAPTVEFFAERGGNNQAASGNGTIGTAQIPNPADIETLDLYLISDPATSEVRAAYRIDGGELQEVPGKVQLTENQMGRFFSEQSKAGIIAHHGTNAADSTTVTFDYFAIDNGDPSDTVAPEVPTGLTATGSQSGVALDWADNSEADLAGYNVYRSASADGTFTKVNDDSATDSQYTDADAPTGTSYYRVTAVDTAGNESAQSGPANADRPSSAQAIRINAGGPAQTVGNVTWEACSSVSNCSGYISGGNAYSENDQITGIPQGMNNAIFQSEWTGGQASGIPAGQTAFTFNVPVENGSYNVRLHFAELNKNASNLRLFDVNLEGGPLELDDYDVFAEAGGIDKAVVEEFPVNVTDGNVTIQFGTVKENAKISAIEILPTEPDTQAPAAPAGLTATGSQSGVALDWADNSEADLAGYNVYRSASANGTFTKVNDDSATDSQYTDADAPGGTSYYQARAVDKSGNESGASNTADAARPEAGGFTNITWTTAAAQQFANSEAQGEVVNGKLYTFGGFDSQKGCCTPTDRADVYDPVANSWTDIKNMPAQNGTNFGGVTHAGFATDGEDIYWAGGYTANSAGTGQIFGTKEAWKYDVQSDSYSRLPDLPQTPESGSSNRHSAGQMEYVDGKLHLIGGTSADRNSDVGYHFVLDLANPQAGWKTAAPLPNPRQHSGSAVVDGKIYYIGGQKDHDAELETQSDVHVYDPATDQWTQKASMPQAIGHISNSTFEMDGRIIVAGGETMFGSGGAVNKVRAYDPQANAWKDLTNLPQSRVSGVANTINGLLFFTTGSGSNTTYKGTPAGYQADATAPTVATTTPGANATGVETGVNVTATFSEVVNERTVTDSNFTLAEQGANTPVAAEVTYDIRSKKATLDPDAALDPGATYTATLTTGVKDLSGNALAQESWNFTTAQPVDTTPPAAPTIGQPANDSYDTDGDVTVSGTAEADSKVELFEGTVSLGETAAGSSGDWSVSLTDVAEGPHTYTAKATDEAGNTSAASSAVTVTVDTEAPTVSARAPQAGATGVATDASITATFSDAMSASTIDGGAFKLTEQGGSTAIPASVGYDAPSKTATLDPNAALKPETIYTATITTGVEDKAGNPLATSETWSFTTKAADPAPGSDIRINTGGPTESFGGVSWGADKNFNGGKSYTNNNIGDIKGTTDDALYKNERSATQNLGSFNYAIPVENGSYTVRLHFAEIYWGATGGGPGGSGKRVFSVNLEGGAVELANYDINADVGPMTAVVKSFDTTVNDGTLNIAFSASVNQPTVAAIEVVESDGPPPDTQAPTASITSGPSGTVTSDSATFEFSADEQTTFECKLDNGGFEDCASPETYEGLTNGQHTFTLRATNEAGNVSEPVSRAWTVNADTTAPTVDNITPPGGAANVPVGANVTATFSEEMDASTINANSFTLTQNGQKVASGIGYDAPSKTATLDPNGALAAGETYTATITTAVKDEAGNPLAQARSWTFATKANDPPASKTALLVAGSTNLNAADNAIRQELIGMGYDVTVESAFATKAASANGKSVVLVSSTVSGSTVGTKFRNVAVPVITWETVQLEPQNLGMTAAGNTGRQSNQSQVAIVNGGHPLAGGLTNGNKPVLKSGVTQMTWGAPNANAEKVATIVGNPNQATIFGYETGDQMPGLVAPARRVGFYLHDPTAANSNANGWTLFRAAVEWAAEGGGGTSPPPPEPAGEPIRINAGGPAQSVGGAEWLACSSTSNCSGYLTGGFQYGKTNAISGVQAPANQAIYQTEWTGGQTNGVPAGQSAFKFDVPVENGSYTVRLHFAEIVQNGVGKRVFDVNLEGGAKELVGFDVFTEAGGLNKAIVREFPVNVTDGSVTIDFIRQVENAKVSAVEIIPAGDNAEQQPTATSLSLKASRSMLVSGKSTVLSGDLATSGGEELSGKRVVLEQKPVRAKSFKPVPRGALTTNSDGSFRMKVTPKANSGYRVRFAGDGEARPASSPSEKVKLKPVKKPKPDKKPKRR